MIYIGYLLITPNYIEQKLCPHLGRADSSNPQASVHLLPNRVVNTANYLGHVVDVLSDLTSRDITIITLSYRNKDVCIFYTSFLQRILVHGIAHHGSALKIRR